MAYVLSSDKRPCGMCKQPVLVQKLHTIGLYPVEVIICPRCDMRQLNEPTGYGLQA